MNMLEINESTFNRLVLTREQLTSQFQGNLSPSITSKVTFSVYGDRYLHVFDPTNTMQIVDQYYDMN